MVICLILAILLAFGVCVPYFVSSSPTAQFEPITAYADTLPTCVVNNDQAHLSYLNNTSSSYWYCFVQFDYGSSKSGFSYTGLYLAPNSSNQELTYTLPTLSSPYYMVNFAFQTSSSYSSSSPNKLAISNCYVIQNFQHNVSDDLILTFSYSFSSVKPWLFVDDVLVPSKKVSSPFDLNTLDLSPGDHQLHFVYSVSSGSYSYDSILDSSYYGSFTIAPSLLPVSGLSIDYSNSILSWDSVDNAELYYIYKDSDYSVPYLTSTSSSVNISEIGSYSVSYLIDGAESPISESITYSPPLLPSTSIYIINSILYWEPVQGATDYYIYRFDDSGIPSRYGIYHGSSDSTMSMTLSSIYVGETFYVVPVDSFGREGSPSNQVLFSITSLVTPLIRSSGNEIIWSSVPSAEGYQVYIVESGSYHLIDTLPSTSTSYYPSRSGDYIIRAYYDLIYSDFSNVLSFSPNEYLGFNPISFFIQPVSEFLSLKLFGAFSLGNAFEVVLFVSLALIFLRIFSGG